MSGAKITEIKDQKGIKVIESLAYEIWPEYYTPIIGAAQVDYMLNHFQSAAAISAQISEGYRYFLIRADNEYVGYFAIFLFEKKRELFISKLYIKSNQRGRGIGRQALGFIEAFARSKGFAEITLMVNKNNLPARQFYEQAGYINTAPIVKDIGGGFVMDDYLYSRKLLDLWAKTINKRKTKSNFLVDDPIKIYYLAIFITAIIFFLIVFLPKPHPTSFDFNKINISNPPYQSAVVYVDPISKNLLGSNFILKPIAAYKIAGRILGKYYYWPYDAWDRLSPFDVMIAWGDLALEENAKYISIEHSMRTHEFKLKPGALFDQKFLTKHASFNHIIAANTNVLDAITTLKTNNIIILEGYLVDVEKLSLPEYQQWKTSLNRYDIGVGSCEILYVTKVTTDNKVYE